MRALKTFIKPDEFTGWHMLGVLGLFFGTIIAVNLTLAFNAVTTWTGLMVKNTYVESQNFDRRRAELAPQATLGWQAELVPGPNALRVNLTDLAGEPLHDAVVTGALGRPVHAGEDQVIAFHPAGEGYEATASLAPGIWRIQLQVIGSQGNVWIKTLRFNMAETREPL